MGDFWLFAPNTTNPAINEPDLPAGHNGDLLAVGAIYRITGAGHTHTLIGGFALPDDNLSGQAGAGHTHLVIRLAAGNYFQRVRLANGDYPSDTDPLDHNHTARLSDTGAIAPDWFMAFWKGDAAGEALIEARADNHIIVHAAADGTLPDEPWAPAELAIWQNRALSVLGFALPPEIDRPRRLVQLMSGALYARQGDEANART